MMRGEKGNLVKLSVQLVSKLKLKKKLCGNYHRFLVCILALLVEFLLVSIAIYKGFYLTWEVPAPSSASFCQYYFKMALTCCPCYT